MCRPIALFCLALLLALAFPGAAAADHTVIDPRLQQALDLIETVENGPAIVAHIHDEHASVVFGNIETAAHYDPNTNTIVFEIIYFSGQNT